MALRNKKVVTLRHGHKLVTAPASEPVTLDEIKDELRIDGTTDDAYITQLISDARDYVERLTGFCFIEQTWRATLDRWPTQNGAWWNGTRTGTIADTITGSAYAAVEFPKYPLMSVTSVTTYDEDSDDTVITVADVFDVDTDSLRGRMGLKSGQTWPTSYRTLNGIEIVYTSGHVNAITIPPGAKRALRQLVCHMYTHRGDDCEITNAYLDSGAASLFSSYADTRLT